MKHKIVILILLFAGFAQAQEETKSYAFTLQEAIAFAIQNNYKALEYHTRAMATVKGIAELEKNLNNPSK